MWLTELEADRLRNLKAVRLEFPAGMTLIAGRNGQGKTSLLEAVYLVATGRSFRTRRLDELVGWEGGPMRVAARLTNRLGPAALAVLVDQGTRRLMADGIEKQIDSYLGRLDMVDLTAERMKVLRGSPDERRRFLDRGAVGLRPELLRALGEYRRVLQQRNALLRTTKGGRNPGAELEAWDERLVLAGAGIHTLRRQYAVRLATTLAVSGRELFTEGEDLVLRYRPSPRAAEEAESGDFAAVFKAALERDRRRDLAVGHTCHGPHRDDLIVELDGVDLRRFGSAGQVRGAMIALKLGKLSLLQEERQESPLFLMDDFDSDLDEVRASSLASFLNEGGFQTLVATSKEAMADRLGVDFMKVRMDDGVARAA